MKFVQFLERILSDKLGYFFQKQLSQSVGRQLAFLFFIACTLIIVFGCVFAVSGVTFEQGNVFWFAVLSLLGPDSLYTIQHESSFIKTLSLLLTLIGIITFNGIIIAIVVSTIHSYFDEIKRGTGKVHEKDTFAILGWNELVPSILAELNVYARTEMKSIPVIILSEEPKKEIVQLTKLNRHLEILFRTGNSYKATDLKRLNLIAAKAIVVFYDLEENAVTNALTQDSLIIKTYISLHALLSENKKISIPIILNFNEIENSVYLEYIKEENTVFFNKNYYKAKFISLLLINPYYYSIFHELLSYEGSEIYFYPTNFVGKSFQSILTSYEKAIPIGVRRNKVTILLPDRAFIIEEKDELIFLSNSSKSIILESKQRQIPTLTFSKSVNSQNNSKAEVIAIIGMNSRVLYVIEEFRKLGKQICIYASESELLWKRKVMAFNLLVDFTEITISSCEFYSEAEIIQQIPLEKFDKILVLSSEEIEGNGKSSSEDTDTLFKVLKLIHLKKINPDKFKYQVLCEIQNPENEEIVRKIPDSNFNYVLGNLIVAKIINMELINPGILNIYQQLLQKGGVDLDIKPLSLYFDMEVDFLTLLENLYEQQQWILIGYIEDESKKIYLNPDKKSLVKPKDHLIYLEESSFKIYNGNP